MCGIFGYVGKRENAADIVFNGLKTLEYRGYDSWGVAVRQKNKQEFLADKNIGKIGNKRLSKDIYKNPSNFSIGHTRWATHGGVTIKNAHPHLDCTGKIAVIHNGIIENFEGIKKELIKKGHIFISETDTEIIPHLIEEFMGIKKGLPADKSPREPSTNSSEKASGKIRRGFASSVRDAFNLLKGFNAIVVSYGSSSEIIACKNGSPLVVGIGEDEFFIASDLSGITPYTKKLVFLKDNEMAILGKTLQILTLPGGGKIKADIETISFNIEESGKGNYEHFMLKEIFDQPKVIRNLTENHIDQISFLAEMIKKAKGTFFIGAGTAYNACLSGMYLFSKISHKHVNTVFASEFNYLEDFLNKESLIIAFSQSGETLDVIESLNRAKKKKSKIIAVVNSLGSTIYRMADYKFLLGAGPEIAVASTKAYIAKLTVLLMIAYEITGKRKIVKPTLLKTADEIERLLEAENLKKIKETARLVATPKNAFVIGRGVSYPSSLEAALKIKEVSYIHTEGLAGGELKHGPIALIAKGTPCLVFAPNDETYDSIVSNATEIKARGGIIIGISPQNSSSFDHWIEVKDIAEGSYIAQVVVAQLLSYYLALFLKLDPDKPRNLAKSVTVK
ncbi:MAG: glutamine--fructose-6-phosphate transaminase (isomerizing) [Patescibacteria group bacterium]|nr:glutamine--fructose-6-phosphate transaminase (isomerizing) [Patescibacteria group bacterium]